MCNITVAALLDTEGITHTLVQHGGTAQVGSILLEGFGTDHATIHSSFPLMSNTGFFVQGRLWYPGDAFFNPGKKPEILALPVSAPWMKLSEAIDYALTLKPDHVFPVHDFILSDAGLAVTYRMTDTILSQNNVTFHPIEIGKEYTF